MDPINLEDRSQIMPVDVVNAFLTIASSVELIMAEAMQQQGQMRMNMASISNQFFRRCGIPAHQWIFCDSLFLRYFAKYSKMVHLGKVFSSHATCFFACICLMNRYELIKLVLDVYSDGSKYLLSYEMLETLLRNVLDTKTCGNIQIKAAEILDQFQSYANTNPVLKRGRKGVSKKSTENVVGSNPIDNNQSKQDIAARNSAGFSPFNIFPRIIPSEIHDDDKGTSSDSKRNDINDQKWNDVSGGDESDTDDDVVELKDVHNYAGAHSAATRVIAYFISKKSPNCLWPVMMLQCQLRKIFMGEEFWQRWQRDTYFQRLRSQQVTSDGFLLAQVLFRDFVATNTCLQEAKLKEEEEHLRRLHLQLQQQVLAHPRRRRASPDPEQQQQCDHVNAERVDTAVPSLDSNNEDDTAALRKSKSFTNLDSYSYKDSSGSQGEGGVPESTRPSVDGAGAVTAQVPSDPKHAHSSHSQSRTPSPGTSPRVPSPLLSSKPRRQPSDSTPFHLGSGLHVLLIEDSKFQRKIMMKRLQSASSQSFSAQDAWTMDCVGSGEEALERLKRGENDAAVLFDVIIVDENLGGAGGELMGHEVVRIVREEMKLTETVIIGCTSNTRKHTQNLLEAGADAVWPKPMPDERDILTQLAYFLSVRKNSRTSFEEIPYPRDPSRVVRSSRKGRKPHPQGSRVSQIIRGR